MEQEIENVINEHEVFDQENLVSYLESYSE